MVNIKIKRAIKNKENNKSGQVTTFVILGIVILAIIVVAVVLITNYREKINLKSSGATEFTEVKNKLDFMFKTCIEGIVKDEAQASILKGGSMSEEFPINNIEYKDQLIITSFDRDNPYVMFKTPNEMAQQLQQIIIDKAPDCFANANEDKLLSQYSLDVSISAVYVKAVDDAFIVNYDYDMEIDGKNETHTVSQNIGVSVFNILNQANTITDNFLMSYSNPDTLYNLQACNSFYEKYNIKPEYPLDILRNVSTNKNVTGVIVQSDFFIVNMDVSGVEFSFAVKPVLVGAIC
jgi:hypothetical protein